MSLPPGFLDELRNRLSLSGVVGRKVVWDPRKSNQGKGDFWAPCPFHQEKSASFHVDDRKGFYYCFGCHAKGDAISFVRETENVGFMEAVEILAREAGLTMPARDPKAREVADRRDGLVAVMEEAVRWFRLQLRMAGGAAARDYLSGRGLDEAAQARWDIGHAPAGWDGLREAMTAKGIAVEALLDCGLVKASDKGRAPYDTFRDRIMFPIRDARGRCIAFGGRAMDPDDKAKYLNSPETVLFDKGRSLFNHGPARTAAGKGAPLIVAEGYMDVIALSEAGFPAAVAPLGTAVTEEQLRMLWRIAPEPLVALDGDRAGIAAARRLMDLALPLVEAGQSLRFALMPEGMDPDDLIRARGPAALRGVLDAARPMVELLWQRETEGKVLDSPERRAALDKSLRAALGRIADPSIRAHYAEEIRRKRQDLFGAGRRAPQGRFEKPRDGARFAWRDPALPRAALAATKSSALARDDWPEDHLREAAILATALLTPAVIAEFESEIERMDCHHPDHARLRDALLRAAGRTTTPEELQAELVAEFGVDPLESLLAERHVAIMPAVRRPGDLATARMSLAEELAKLSARHGHARELDEAMADFSAAMDEGLTWRLGQAAEAVNRAGRPDGEDDADYDTGPNGASVRRDERSAFSDLLGQIDFGRAGRRRRD